MSTRLVSQISCFIVFNFCLCLHANIDNLKDTFDILKDEYKQFSILNGAIAIETDYVMRLYDFGTLGRMKKITTPDKRIVDVPDPSSAPEVVKLVYLFFHRTPGTNSRGDFVFTQELRNFSEDQKRTFIESIAWMMAQAKQLEDKLASKGEGAKHKRTEAQSIIKALVATHKDREGFFSFQKEVDNFHYLASLMALSPEIIEQKPDAFAIFKPVWQSMQQEAGTMAQVASGAKPIFPKFTTNAVLLGIVYKLAGMNKRLLQVFYEKLNETIRHTENIPSIFVNDVIPANWVNEKFNPAERQMLGESLSFAATDFDQLKRYYENIVYLFLLPGNYPQIAGYLTTHYYYDLSDPTKVVDFSDCMDNIYRNLFNILLYDKESVSFNLNKIATLHPIPSFINFYTNNKDVADAESSTLHKRWTQVIENIPLATYNRKVGTDIKAHDIGKKGYIKVPEGIDLGEGYIRVGNNDVVYEIEPSTRNIIIVFNYLLGLDLFANEPGNTPEEKAVHAFMRPNFIKTYFSKMCEKLGIKFNGFYLINGTRIDDTIDTQDYNPDGTLIIIKMQVNKAASDTDVGLYVKWVHGEMTVTDKINIQNRMMEWIDSNVLSILSSAGKIFTNYFFSLPYLVVQKLSGEDETLLTSIDPVNRFNMLYYQPINNANYIKNLIKENISRTNYNENALCLLFYLVNTIPDEYQKESAKLKMYNAIVRYPKWSAQKGITGLKKSSAMDLIKVATDAAESGNTNIQLLGLRLVKSLIEKGQGYSKAVQLANKAVKSKNDLLRAQGFDLFFELVKQMQAYPEAIVAAVDAAKDNRFACLYLFQLLFERGQGIPAAVHSVVELVASKDRYLNITGVELLKTIYEQLAKIPAEKLTPELKETIKQAIEVGKLIDASTEEGQKTLRMAQELERKMAKKE